MVLRIGLTGESILGQKYADRSGRDPAISARSSRILFRRLIANQPATNQVQLSPNLAADNHDHTLRHTGLHGFADRFTVLNNR